MKKSNKKGFTLVELVIVIAVIGILAAVLIPTITSVVSKAEKTTAETEARNIYAQAISVSNSFDAYCKDHEKDKLETDELQIGDYIVKLRGKEDFGIGVLDGAWTIAYITASGYLVKITSEDVNAPKVEKEDKIPFAAE